jgi:uncharacterized protein (DUF924 family)
MLLTVDQINNILSFWFPNNTFNKFWFDENIEIDSFIFTNYKNLMNNIYDKITINLLEELEYNELLSIIILFDQFSRNINRIESVDINKFTIMAKEISLLLIKKDICNNSMNHITFILMPLRHLNIKEDYILILDILDKLKNKDCMIFNKFKNQTIKRFKLFN